MSIIRKFLKEEEDFINMKKVNKAKRESDFNRNYSEKLKEIGFVKSGDKWVNEDIEYYPKTDRVLIKNGNIWKSKGLDYLKALM